MKPNMKYTPPVTIDPNFNASFQAARKHVLETTLDYNKQYFVNLIDKKGSQLRIGTKMTELVKQMNDPNIYYTWFDFHGECKKMKWENLSKLIAIVKQEFLEFGHTMVQLNVLLDKRSSLTAQTCKFTST